MFLLSKITISSRYLAGKFSGVRQALSTIRMVFVAPME
jgi:hypothetical protein